MINLLSPFNHPVLGEGGHIRERKPNEVVHFYDGKIEACAICGWTGNTEGVWTDRPNLFDAHPSRCGERKKDRPDGEKA